MLGFNVGAVGFDPYEAWLGVPASGGTPNHYRLLGLPDFESDQETIRRAADARMRKLRGLQTGKHATDATRLLSEVARARACLTNPQLKSAYDKKLSPVSDSALQPLPGLDDLVPQSEMPLHGFAAFAEPFSPEPKRKSSLSVAKMQADASKLLPDALTWVIIIASTIAFGCFCYLMYWKSIQS